MADLVTYCSIDLFQYTETGAAGEAMDRAPSHVAMDSSQRKGK